MLDMIDRDFVEHLFHFHNIFDKNMTIYNRSTGKIRLLKINLRKSRNREFY